MSWLPSNTTPSFVLLVRVPCTSITAKGASRVLGTEPSPIYQSSLPEPAHHSCASRPSFNSSVITSFFEQSTSPGPALVEWPHPPPFQPPEAACARGGASFSPLLTPHRP